MMDQTISSFPQQLSWIPDITGRFDSGAFTSYVVCGMGGSHLAADILKRLKPTLNLIVHSDYDLPLLKESSKQSRLVIASSYSGNTEETITSFNQALAQGCSVAAITTGGRLLELAQDKDVPYIKLPVTGIQPRSALGYSLRALLKILGQTDLLEQTAQLADTLKATDWRSKGQTLAETIKGKVPLIYASARNYALAYNWKIKLNETGKIPAFYNLLPELNHNEMTGFAYTDLSKPLSSQFYFIMLADQRDEAGVQTRMRVLTEVLEGLGLPVITVAVEGDSETVRVFNSLILADWLAYYTALQYGAEPEQVPLVEQFKKKLKP